MTKIFYSAQKPMKNSQMEKEMTRRCKYGFYKFVFGNIH
jgi:hypothetical protein